MWTFLLLRWSPLSRWVAGPRGLGSRRAPGPGPRLRLEFRVVTPDPLGQIRRTVAHFVAPFLDSHTVGIDLFRSAPLAGPARPDPARPVLTLPVPARSTSFDSSGPGECRRVVDSSQRRRSESFWAALKGNLVRLPTHTHSSDRRSAIAGFAVRSGVAYLYWGSSVRPGWRHFISA